MTPDELRLYRQRQRGRSIAMGIVLGVLAILFFGITIAKMG